MQIIRQTAHARAGLVGNPSDGYGGKTIALIVPQFRARVTLYEWEDVEVVWSQQDRGRFRSVQELVEDVRSHGYYGGVRLVKATIKRFVEFCQANDLPLHDRNFSARYETNIPRQVGMGGSSAIIIATLRCLMAFYGVTIPKQVQPSLALSVETDELGIAAGLQDRVVQIYEDLVYMDFDPAVAETDCGLKCGRYETLAPPTWPPLYLAYHTSVGEPTEIVHNNLRTRFNNGDAEVLQAMKRFAKLAAEGREALQRGDAKELHRVLDENFDLRKSICQISAWQQEMIDVARSCGASAKFAGSGGAIIGTYDDPQAFDQLREEMSRLDCETLKLAPRAASYGKPGKKPNELPNVVP